MRSRLQGSICLVAGLIGLAVYIFGSPTFVGSGSAQLSHGEPLILPLADDSMKITYWGEMTEVVPGSSTRAALTVTCYYLPRSVSGARTIVVHVLSQPISSSIFDTVSDSERLAVFEQQSNGLVSEIFVSEGLSLAKLPLDLLFLTRPIGDDTHYRCIGRKGEGEIELALVPGSEEIQQYSVSGSFLSVALAAGDRRTKVAFKSNRLELETLEVNSRWTEDERESRTNISLFRGNTSQMQLENVRTMSSDLAMWASTNSHFNLVLEGVSTGEHQQSEAFYKSLSKLSLESSKQLEKFSNPITRAGYRDFIMSPGATFHRAHLGSDCLIRLAEAGRFDWSTESGHNSSEYLGKVLVMGFIYRGNGEVESAIRTLVELRREFDPELVHVLALSTDVHEVDRSTLEEIMEPRIDVAQGRALAYQSQLFNCGVPVILVCDQNGRPSVIHACQTRFVERTLKNQIYRLIQDQPNATGLTQQLDRSTFPSGTINGFDYLHADPALAAIN